MPRIGRGIVARLTLSADKSIMVADKVVVREFRKWLDRASLYSISLTKRC